ncbi:MAG: M67 family peptidase [Planctomycetota bacterium]|nr:MAG: M67 family peptidase [Planctomycetota bacterium]
MLTIPRNLLDAIYEHGEEAFPTECCGILIGFTDGTNRTVVAIERARNLRAEEANDRYEIDAGFRKIVEEKAHDKGLCIVGFYHSHPDHNAYFSQTDLECSEEYIWGQPWIPPTYSYPVVSIRDGRGSHHKCFIVVDGKAVEEDLNITSEPLGPTR